MSGQKPCAFGDPLNPLSIREDAKSQAARKRRWCEISISHPLSRGSDPAPATAGRGSRSCACENGFSHEPRRRTRGPSPHHGSTSSTHATRRRGAALILVLWAIVMLSLLAGGLTFVIRQDLAIASLQQARLVAHCLARAGVERAMATLTDDLTSTDTVDEYWYDDPANFQEISLEGGTFSVIHGSDDLVPVVKYGASDESGKLNLNVATREQLLALPDMTEPIADAVTMTTRLMLEPWAAQSIVKARQNKQFENLVDLLDVERDTETPRGDEESDINARDDDEQDKPVTLGIFKRIVGDITLSNEDILAGRINVNTAPREVLMTLSGVDGELADAILEARDKRGGLTSIGDLLDVGGLTKEKFAKMEKQVTVRSQVFRIVSYGEAASGLARATIECVVSRGSNGARAVYWLESTP